MPLLSQDEALARARRIVEASPAGETEVTLDGVVDRFVRFADCGPTQSADRERCDVAVRVRVGTPGVDAREARASSGSLDEGALRAALERALALAQASPPDPELAPLGGPVDVAETALQRPTMDHTFREKVRWVEHALARTRERELFPAGLIETSGMTRTIVNSAGRAVHGERSRAAFSLTASSGVDSGLAAGSGFGAAIASNVEDIDPGRVVERATRKAVASRDPVAIEPGEYTVVLEPAAVGALLLFTGYRGFGARELEEKGSFLCGRLGRRAFSAGLSIRDDAAHEVYPGFLFDGEGSPRRRTALVERGELRGPVTDARWAKRLGIANTGHARPQPSARGPAPENLVVAPGDASLEELVAGVERGLLVTQLHCTSMIEPLGLTLTGTTRNGTFLIEDGSLAAPVRNLRFTQSLVEALGRVRRVGREPEVAGAPFSGEIVCPALCIDGFRFTSTTDLRAPALSSRP